MHRVRIAPPVYLNAVWVGDLDLADDRAATAANHNIVRFAGINGHRHIVAELRRPALSTRKIVLQVDRAVARGHRTKAEVTIRIRFGVIIDVERRLGTAIRIVHLITRMQRY